MIDLNALQFYGSDLRRPECVLATRTGHLHVADWRGGVTIIAPDGSQRSVLAKGTFVPKPNGIAIVQDGWLLAHLGDDDGGVFHLSTEGQCTPFLIETAEGPLPPTNYPHVDSVGRVWVTVSTRKSPRNLSYNAQCDDGFIVVMDENGSRIAGDGLGYTNECLVHPEDGHLYVNETFARRLSRFEIGPDNILKNRTTITEFGEGIYPDGLCFDAEGGIWITSIVSNRVIRVDRDGHQTVILEDADPGHITWAEQAYQDGKMGRPHLDTAAGKILKNISSLAFGGPDMKTAYLGCLLGDRIASFRTDQPGLTPSHWEIAHG